MTEINENDPKEVKQMKTLDEEFTRANKHINACGFDEKTLIQRDKDLKELQKMYPTLPISWLEMTWNFCKYTPEEKQNEIIEKDLWKKPLVERQKGGILKNVVIEPKPE